MEEKAKKQLPVLTKVSLVINILLFGITGAIYLINGNNFLGIILLAAGLTNILWALFSFQVRNTYFAILNFVFAAVALIVSVDYQFTDKKYLAMLWIAIMLVYLIIGFMLLLFIKKNKSASQQ